MDRRTLFWNLLLVASGIAACVSLLTTGVGLARYLPLMLAWPLALAVQLGLFGLAWLIAIGRAKLRPLVVGLYCLTMPFSVVFSYVMLQSEFTDEIRPEEAQRALFDDLRQRSSQVAAEIDASLAESKELELRLASWVEMERSEGWTTATCDDNENCYLAGVCERVQLKIDNWERRSGQTYRQGPGEALIFGSLETETQAVNQIAESLRVGREEWVSNESLFEAGLDNRERLRRYDLALANLPQRDMQEVRCEAVVLPPSPPYELFARDNALSEEKLIYAFEDLAAVFSLSHESDRADYPTIFAFFLALFIDLFVLFVAIGGAVVGVMDTPGGDYPVIQPVPPEWGDALQRDITSWIDGALLQACKSAEDRKVFLRGPPRSALRARQACPARAQGCSGELFRLPDGERQGCEARPAGDRRRGVGVDGLRVGGLGVSGAGTVSDDRLASVAPPAAGGRRWRYRGSTSRCRLRPCAT